MRDYRRLVDIEDIELRVLHDVFDGIFPKKAIKRLGRIEIEFTRRGVTVQESSSVTDDRLSGEFNAYQGRTLKALATALRTDKTLRRVFERDGIPTSEQDFAMWYARNDESSPSDRARRNFYRIMQSCHHSHSEDKFFEGMQAAEGALDNYLGK